MVVKLPDIYLFYKVYISTVYKWEFSLIRGMACEGQTDPWGTFFDSGGTHSK